MGLVVVGQDGGIRAVYDDELAGVLRELNGLEVRRASEVEFDNELQGWLVTVRANPALGIVSFHAGPFPRRSEALAWEGRYLEGRLAGEDDRTASRQAGKAVC